MQERGRGGGARYRSAVEVAAHKGHSVHEGFCYSCQEWIESEESFRARMAERRRSCAGCPCIEQGDLGACCYCGVDVDAHAEVLA